MVLIDPLQRVLNSPLVDPVEFLPSNLPGLKIWTRFNQGITLAGQGVSQWDDQSGNGNHLKQGTDANRPTLEGDGSILFPGVDEFLKTDAFTMTQPETIFLLGHQVTWASDDTIFDGNTFNSGRMYGRTPSPNVSVYAGGLGAINSEWAVGIDAVIMTIFDHDEPQGVIQVNHGAPAIDPTFGTNDMGGFTLAAAGNGTAVSHIKIKEAIVYATAIDIPTRKKIINYLAGVGSLSL